MTLKAQLIARPWLIPVLGGLLILALSAWIIPPSGEVRDALKRGRRDRVAQTALRPPQPAHAPPEITKMLAHDDARAIARAVEEMASRGILVTTTQIAHDLDRIGRYAVALAFLQLRRDGDDATLWRLRFEMLRKLGQAASARDLLVAATQTGSQVPPQDIIEAAYSLGALELVLEAAEHHIIPSPDARLSLDLARRFESDHRYELVSRLDLVSQAQWRSADPWLAIKIARALGQHAQALRYAMLLPQKDRESAREVILREQGDFAALRSALLARAQRPNSAVQAISEQLLGLGFRDDAIRLMADAAASVSPQHPLGQRLLFLMGPRPAPAELRWLQGRTMAGTAANQQAWLDVYAQRDRPKAALAYISRHPLANQIQNQLTCLSLARMAGDQSTGDRLFAALLDEPALTAMQLAAVSALAPARLDPATIRKLSERRVSAGVSNASDWLSLAWASWNSADSVATITSLSHYLRDNPTDLAGLQLMADAQLKAKGQAAARPWRERALARTALGSRERAQVLESLGRFPEAIAIVRPLVADQPGDKALIALQARLLLANGQPGRARKLLAL